MNTLADRYPGWRELSRLVKRECSKAQEAPIGNPEGWTLRDEANVLTAYCFRNGFLEDLHSGPNGFSDDEMRKLMTEASAGLTVLLFLKHAKPEVYAAFLRDYRDIYCRDWSRTATEYKLTNPSSLSCKQCSGQVRSGWMYCPSCGQRISLE